MKTFRLILALPGLLTVVACASGTRPVVPDGRERVAANSPARISQFIARIDEDSAAQQERIAWARQLDDLRRQVAEMKTFVFLMLMQNGTRAGDIAPVDVSRGPVTPPVPPAASAGRPLKLQPSEAPSAARLGLAPGETPVDDTPRPRLAAAAEGAAALMSEPARNAPAARSAAVGQPGPAKEAEPVDQPAPSAAVAADTAAMAGGQPANKTAGVTERPVSNRQPMPEPAKVEQWIAKGGSTLRTELLRWAERAGWRVIYDTTTDYQLIHDVPMPGRFDEAVAALVRLYEVADQPLIADISVSQHLVYITNRPSN